MNMEKYKRLLDQPAKLKADLIDAIESIEYPTIKDKEKAAGLIADYYKIFKAPADKRKKVTIERLHKILQNLVRDQEKRERPGHKG